MVQGLSRIWQLTILGFFLAGSSSVACASDGMPLYTLSDAQSRSITAENITGEKGGGARTPVESGTAAKAASSLGFGWKVNPYLFVKSGETITLGEAKGPGVINHIWMALGGNVDYRSMIIRIYWDDETLPSVEVPAGDFFATGWGRFSETLVNSAMVMVTSGGGFNSYWPMPFHKKFRITLENRSTEMMIIYHQIDYTLQAVPENAAYFHAQFRLSDRLKEKDVHTILDGVKGQGQYVGTYVAHGAFSAGWWGEGEVKFYLDGDTDHPTINGTGEEDYFLGAWGYLKSDGKGSRQEIPFSMLYAGFHNQNPPTSPADYFIPGRERRISEYRWHIKDPIHFKKDLRITMQSLGWNRASLENVLGDGTYLSLQDYIASVAYWYQAEPHAAFPALPDNAALTIPPLQTGQ